MTASARTPLGLGIGLAVIGLGGCTGGGSGGAATGELSLAITDASVDDVTSIIVKFTGVRLKPEAGPAIDIPLPAPLEIDMLTLTNGDYATLFGDTEVPAGVYNWIELQVEAELDTVYDSYVMTDTGGMVELRIPSGSETGLRLVSGFTVTADQMTSLMIDWDMRQALIDAPGQGDAFMLRPAFRIIDMTEYGIVTGTIPESLVNDGSCTNDLVADTGNAVYVYEPLVGATADDIDSLGATPVATASVKQTDGVYGYQIILSPGHYSIAFTCQASLEAGADEDIAFTVASEDVDVQIGGTSTPVFP